MRNKINLDLEWLRAVGQAMLSLKAERADVAAVAVQLALHGACPLSLDDLVSDPADPVALVERLSRAIPLVRRAVDTP